MSESISDDELPGAIERSHEGSPTEIYYAILGLVERGRIEEAKALSIALVDKGYLDAGSALAEALYAADGPEPNFEQWLALMSAHANSQRPGCAIAAFDIGCCYEDERGDPATAQEWYRLAADEGVDEAAIFLGYSYLNGNGVPQDLIEAVRWFMKASTMEPGELSISNYEEWPVQSGVGWVDLDLLAEILGMLDLDGRQQVLAIIGEPVRQIPNDSSSRRYGNDDTLN